MSTTITNPGSMGSSLGVIVTIMDTDTLLRPRVPTRRRERPRRDEWGMFDPAQCGIDAILAKIEKLRRSR